MPQGGQGAWSRPLGLLCDMSLGDFLRKEAGLARQYFGNLQTAMFSHPMMPHLMGAPGNAQRFGDRQAEPRPLRRCRPGGTTAGVPLANLPMFRLAGSGSCAWENKTSCREKVGDHDPDTLRQLREITALDAELYHFGLKLFERQMAAMQQRLSIPQSPRDLPSAAVFAFDGPIPGYGWHLLEKSPHGDFCWSDDEPWLEFPLAGRGLLSMRVCVLALIPPNQINELELFVNGHRVNVECREDSPGWALSGSVNLPSAEQEAGRVRLEFRLPRLIRPCDVNPASCDTRKLGVAVHRVELSFAACKLFTQYQ